MDCYFESSCSFFFGAKNETAQLASELNQSRGLWRLYHVPRWQRGAKWIPRETETETERKRKQDAWDAWRNGPGLENSQFLYNLLPISQCLHHVFASFYSPRFNLHHFTVLFQRSYRVTGEPKDTFALQGHEPSHRATHPAERLQSRRFSTKSTSVKKTMMFL